VNIDGQGRFVVSPDEELTVLVTKLKDTFLATISDPARAGAWTSRSTPSALRERRTLSAAKASGTDFDFAVTYNFRPDDTQDLGTQVATTREGSVGAHCEGENMYSKEVILGLSIVAACGLSACNRGPASGGTTNSGAVTTAAAQPPATIVSCAALTAEKASEVLHANITLTVGTSDGNGESNCTYTYSTGGAVRAYVVVGPEAERTYEATKGGVTQPTDVSGVGDKAFDSDQGFNAIKQDHYVGVVGTTPGDQTGKRRLAEAMLDAL
jgi:hypothetical protein